MGIFGKENKKGGDVSVTILRCSYCKTVLRPGRHHTCEIKRERFFVPLVPKEDSPHYVPFYTLIEKTDTFLRRFVVGGLPDNPKQDLPSTQSGEARLVGEQTQILHYREVDLLITSSDSDEGSGGASSHSPTSHAKDASTSGSDD
jgi:hypothetical protein